MSVEGVLEIHPSLALIFPTKINERAKNEHARTEDIDPDAAWHFYSHSIRRNPNNLNLHTHRVFFAMQHRDGELLAGSLHDLFFVLKDAGEKLRMRLLKASLPYLNKEDSLYFAMWIKTGIKKGMGYQWVNGSVLADGLYGPDNELITMQKTDKETISPIEEARMSMELGQLNVAKHILEEALVKDPGDEAIFEELTYLTQYTKSREINPDDQPKKSKIGKAIVKIKEKIFS